MIDVDIFEILISLRLDRIIFHNNTIKIYMYGEGDMISHFHKCTVLCSMHTSV